MLDESKIAICISGLFRKGCDTSLKNIYKALPYDTFYLHWEGYDKPNVPNCVFVPEPKYDYHCTLDTKTKPDCKIYRSAYRPPNPPHDRGGKMWWKPNYYNNTKECSKQLLAHYYLLNTLPEKYETIVRIRYDLLVSTKVDFRPYLELAQNGVCVGFAGSYQGMRGPEQKLTPHINCNCNNCSSWYMWDNMYFHPRHKFKNVQKFHDEKNLLGAEWGLYQVLCDQWKDRNFLNVWGGVAVLRYLSSLPEEWINL